MKDVKKSRKGSAEPSVNSEMPLKNGSKKEKEEVAQTATTPCTGKPLRLRGVGTMNLSSGEFDFKPYGEGVAVKKKEKKAGDSSFYETENSVIAHLKADKNDPDAIGKMYDQLEKLTKDSQVKEPKKPTSRPILDNASVKVWIKGSESKVIVRMELDNSRKQLPSLCAQLFNQTQEVNKCFAINKAQLER